ncbi:hypothetical protein D3C76_1735070 [compost metagenome]
MNQIVYKFKKYVLDIASLPPQLVGRAQHRVKTSGCRCYNTDRQQKSCPINNRQIDESRQNRNRPGGDANQLVCKGTDDFRIVVQTRLDFTPF